MARVAQQLDFEAQFDERSTPHPWKVRVEAGMSLILSEAQR